MRTALASALAVALSAPLVLHAAPPVAAAPLNQVWIDLATFSGMGMPGTGAAGGNPMQMLGRMLDGSRAGNRFGNTQSGSAGQWMDVTVFTRRNPALDSATHVIPAALKLGESLRLQAPRVRAVAEHDTDAVVEADYERPRGKLLLYWGCGEQVRAAQPRVLDMATADPRDVAAFFVVRRATQRGAHSAAGRPQWPNPADERLLPEGASVVGAHAFSGEGIVESLRFSIPREYDLLPPIAFKQAQRNGATLLSWQAMPQARAFFIGVMGARADSNGAAEMVLWTSSERPETGFGLVDYQPNRAIDGWLKDKVLLGPATRECAIPKGVFGDGAMLRMIAYGNELNLAHPPRPVDAKTAWQPEWTAKLRIKSVHTALLGMASAPNAQDLLREGLLDGEE